MMLLIFAFDCLIIWNERRIDLTRHCRFPQQYYIYHLEFRLTEHGSYFLKQLTSPIAVVSIAGMYRTGKSYLVNKLVRAKQAFKTGGTTQSVTQGLNILGKPIYATDE